MRNDKTIKRLLGIITFDQTYTEFALPIVTLMFFDPASHLFPDGTSMAVRSMWYGTCISIPYFINLFFAPFLSTLSDEFGRRKFLLFEITSSFFYMLLTGLGVVTGMLWLVVSGFVVRGAFSRTNTTALAMIGDACTKHKKMAYMSYLQIAISIGACIGPIVSGFFARRYYFDVLNFSLPFFLGAFCAFINACLTYYFIDETLQQKTSDAWMSHTKSRLYSNLLSVKYVFTHPHVLVISLILLLTQICWAMYYQFMPPLLKNVYHFDDRLLGFFIGMIAFWLIVAAGPIFKIIHTRFNIQQMLNFGALIEIAGILLTLLVYFKHLPQLYLWAAAMPVAAGDMLIYICLTTLYSNVVSNHMQGKVMGINFLIVGLIWGSTGFIGGMLIIYTPILPLLIAPCGLLAAILVINSKVARKISLSPA